MEIKEKQNMVFLSDEQAALFILFMKHYDSFGLMIQSGVFDIVNGNAILSFDGQAKLKTIKRELFTYVH